MLLLNTQSTNNRDIGHTGQLLVNRWSTTSSCVTAVSLLDKLFTEFLFNLTLEIFDQTLHKFFRHRWLCVGARAHCQDVKAVEKWYRCRADVHIISCVKPVQFLVKLGEQ